jgi:hypothetical protein
MPRLAPVMRIVRGKTLLKERKMAEIEQKRYQDWLMWYLCRAF